MGVKYPLEFYIMKFEDTGAHDDVIFYPRKHSDQSNSLGKRVKCMCDPLGGNNSIVAYLQKI